MTRLLISSSLALLLGGGAAIATANAATDQTASYCGQGWTKVDANDNGFVTKSEAKQAGGVVFEEMDADGNGKVSKSEYTDCMQNWMQRWQQAAAKVERDEASFAEVDTDQDNQITTYEFVNGWRKAYDIEKAGQAKDDRVPSVAAYTGYVTAPDDKKMSEQDSASRAAAMFKNLDTDRSGTLSPEEWSAPNPENIGRHTLDLNWETMDTNGDGFISSMEYDKARDARFGEAQEQAGKAQEQAGAAQDQAGKAQDQAGDQQTSADVSASGSSATGVPVYLYRFYVM